MFCKNCGSPLDDNASFCGNCGAKVNQEKAQAEPSSNKKKTFATEICISDSRPASRLRRSLCYSRIKYAQKPFNV